MQRGYGDAQWLPSEVRLTKPSDLVRPFCLPLGKNVFIFRMEQLSSVSSALRRPAWPAVGENNSRLSPPTLTPYLLNNFIIIGIFTFSRLFQHFNDRGMQTFAAV